MSAEAFEAACLMLWPDRPVAGAGDLLGMSRRGVQRLAADERDIPPGVAAKITAEVRRRLLDPELRVGFGEIVLRALEPELRVAGFPSAQD